MAGTRETKAPTASATSRKKRSRLFTFGLVVLVLAVSAVSMWAYKEINSAEENLESSLAMRAGLIVDGRVDALENHLRNMRSAAGRLVDAEMFKYFAFEVDQYDGDVSALVSAPRRADPLEVPVDHAEKVADQLPLWAVNLRDFIQSEGFISGRVVNSKGDTYISTLSTMSPLRPGLKDQVNQVLQTGMPLFSPVYAGQTGLAHDIILPILAPAFEQGNKPVSALILTKAATGTDSLSELVTSSAVTAEGFMTHFIQKVGNEFQEVGLGSGSEIKRISMPDEIGENRMPFGMRTSVASTEQVYSMGRKVAGTDWWIVQERNYAESRQVYQNTVRSILGIAGLTSLVLMLLVSLLWWRLVGKEQQEIASQFKELAQVIDDQKQLLDGINSAMTDPVSLTDAGGVYRYVNKAFARAVGREVEEIIGLDTAAVFGFDTARRLALTDERVLKENASLTVNETIWLQSKRHFFQISKAPLQKADGDNAGIVSVLRDITKQVEALERSNRVVQETIDALVRAIEASDPFLGGHSRIMGSIAGLIGRTMHLPERDVATITAAASLSQIGKMFVPREVLTKPGALTDEEKKLMEQHVEHAREVLQNIEFELPVLDAVYQMNERLDGRGYPKGLKADEINIPAKVLAVANAFTAMARPRSYRPALPVEEVLAVLGKQKDAYDQTVVAALEAVLKTPAGERIVAHAASSKAH